VRLGFDVRRSRKSRTRSFPSTSTETPPRPPRPSPPPSLPPSSLLLRPCRSPLPLHTPLITRRHVMSFPLYAYPQPVLAAFPKPFFGAQHHHLPLTASPPHPPLRKPSTCDARALKKHSLLCPSSSSSSSSHLTPILPTQTQMAPRRRPQPFSLSLLPSLLSCLPLLLLFLLPHPTLGQLDTLLGLQGRDFVLLAADPVLSRSLLLLHSHHDKLPPLGPHHCLALGGPVYFTEIISEVLGAEKRLFEKRLRRPLTTKAVANMAR